MGFLKKLLCCFQPEEENPKVLPIPERHEPTPHNHKRYLSDKLSDIEKHAIETLNNAELAKAEEKKEYIEATRELNFAARAIYNEATFAGRYSFQMGPNIPAGEITLTESPQLTRCDI